jgi:hypothetical protein
MQSFTLGKIVDCPMIMMYHNQAHERDGDVSLLHQFVRYSPLKVKNGTGSIAQRTCLILTMMNMCRGEEGTGQGQ